MRARRSSGGKAARNGAYPFLILLKRPEHIAARDARPEYQSGASKSWFRVWIRGGAKTPPSWGTRVARLPPYGIPR